jgi:hypothetical protein
VQDVFRDLIAEHRDSFAETCKITMGIGWTALLKEVAIRYAESGLKITEVYSKLGSMRVHPICSAIEESLKIYHRSMATCEDCGQPGLVRNIQGYCRATCDTHELEWAAYMKRMYR